MYHHIAVLIVLLITVNFGQCYIINKNENIPIMEQGTLKYPLIDSAAVGTSSMEKNDRAVYDPGVDNFPSSSAEQKSLFAEQMPSVDNFPSESDDEDKWLTMQNNVDANANMMTMIKNEIQNDEDIAIKSAFLMRLLEKSSVNGPLPLVYVEDQPKPPVDSDMYSMDKRTGRYYMRYPWKRQNTRNRTYEADSRYLCVPSREDVFKLLVGLHENRNGNHHKTVNFCNRKRPAKAIFTNIRFLG